MIKLNGNVYLKVEEVEKFIDETKTKFRTSHRAILPQKINYFDREFVDLIAEEAKNTSLFIIYLYGYNYACINDLIYLRGSTCTHIYFYLHESCFIIRHSYINMCTYI